MSNDGTFFATTPKGIEPLLTEELKALGATGVTPGRGGVTFQGALTTAYRACLWSRTANRILLPLRSFPAPDPNTLYQGVRAIPWEEHLTPDGTLSVDFSATGSGITHTQFAAQKIKDAIVDHLRERYGRRPSVDRRHPNLRINGYLLNDVATISLDLSGDSLHRRGYRQGTVIAPLKENLAAALLLKADWPAIVSSGGPFLDPMCGSGTWPIEAALLAADIAPGLRREYWGFLGWLRHDPDSWAALVSEARQRRDQGITKTPPIIGYDQDADAIRAALVNATRAGVQELVHFERRELSRVQAPFSKVPGLLMANPPYGERLGEVRELESLYAQLGDLLQKHFPGWKAAVFTSNPELGKRMGLRAWRINSFYNGALACKLLRFSVEPGFFVDREKTDARIRELAPHTALAEGAKMFANRLSKNLHTLSRWAEREGISCYRLYDADIPEYAVAVDIYERWVHVQAYQAPRSIDPRRAQERLEQIMAVIPTVLGIPIDQVFLKERKCQKGSDQYQKHADTGRFFEVREGPARFLVNFTDYLDTGLFLDHRRTRQLIGNLAKDRRFLNLFGYTGTASVYAALGGAVSTTTVDISQTYLSWAQRNFNLNGIDSRHHSLVRADCLDWLDRSRDRYDLIFLDPPTFSNSKRMATSFDVQRDHVELIHQAVRTLDKGGILIFSNNYRDFKLDREGLAGLTIEDITRQTLPKDFERHPKIHRCWQITRAAE